MYNPVNDVVSENSVEFYAHAMRHKNSLEAEINEPEYNQNNFLNDNFSFDRIFHIICKLNKNKAVGIDLIPNDVLKNVDVGIILTKYFNLLFKTGIVPSLWLKSVINPIPKGAGKDPYIPLNYRGISLLSCIGK